MRVGDLIKVVECPERDTMLGVFGDCTCFFCKTGSNRVGLIMGPAPRNAWQVMFDTGMWRLDEFDFARGDAKIISKQGTQ